MLNHRKSNNWADQDRWYSWSSPVGLGVYPVLLAGAVWILAHLKPTNKK